MAASWPSAKKTFSQVINGVTKLIALLFNTNYDEVEALQTFIGAPGAAQTHLAALLDTIKDSYYGGRCYKKDANNIYVGPFSGIITDAAGTVKKLRVSTSVTTLAAANIDTGAFAAATYYYIYATADAAATTPTFVISASASAPTGYTYYRKIGWFYNETISILDITGGNVSTFIGGDNDTQKMHYQRQDLVTCSTIIPKDNTKPQISEGTEIFRGYIIPSATVNEIEIEVVANGVDSAASAQRVIALFKVGTNDALAISNNYDIAGYPKSHTIICRVFPGSVSPIIFTVNAGAESGNLYINGGSVSTPYYDSTLISSLTIREKKP
jgi:hypothetical protein